MDSKKKKLIIILSVVGVIVLAAVIAIAVIFTREQEKPATEGSIYITESVDNGMAGDSYISFDYVPEPAEPVEGERYGYVFHLWCSYIGSDGYQDWLTGYWELDGDTLTLTAFWEDGATTYLDGAESGVAKVYNAEDGKFYIAVEIGGQGVKTITLDPAADKVGEVTDDEGDEGNEDETPVAPDKVTSLTATDAATTMQAAIDLYDDQTFAFMLSGEKAFGGTWAFIDTENMMAGIILTVDETGAPVIGDTVTVTIAPKTPGDYTVFTYSCHVDYVVTQVTMSFDFTGEYAVSAPEPEPEPTPAEPMLTMTATGSSGYVTANAKLELFAESQMNGTWKLSIDFGTGYVEQASGTYALNMTTYDLDLTVTTGAQYINNVQTFSIATNGGTNYTCTVVSTAAGEITLNFTGALAQA